MDDTECTPLTQGYKFLSGNKYSQKVTCKKNSAGCAAWACECDVTLAETVANLMKEGAFDIKMAHNTGEFDSDAICHWEGDFDVHDECCGEYPDRLLFKYF